MAFTSLVEPVSKRPRPAVFGPAGGHNFIRDQLSITTWLALGAVIEGILFLLVGYKALLAVLVLLGYRLADTFIILMGLKRNPQMDNVVRTKFSAQIPDEFGEFSGKPADSEITVFLIGARCNHPLGMLAPGFKQLGAYFTGMAADLETHAEEFGMMGMTAWQSSSQRTTNNEILTICYFKTYDGLHRFAHSEYHREGWRWFEREVGKLSHLSIYHETYSVPSGNWETIYMNSHPSHFASSTFKINDPVTNEEKYASPIVDATRGLLRTSKGRMGRSNANENDKYYQGYSLNDVKL